MKLDKTGTETAVRESSVAITATQVEPDVHSYSDGFTCPIYICGSDRRTLLTRGIQFQESNILRIGRDTFEIKNNTDRIDVVVRPYAISAIITDKPDLLGYVTISVIDVFNAETRDVRIRDCFTRPALKEELDRNSTLVPVARLAEQAVMCPQDRFERMCLELESRELLNCGFRLQLSPDFSRLSLEDAIAQANSAIKRDKITISVEAGPKGRVQFDGLAWLDRMACLQELVIDRASERSMLEKGYNLQTPRFTLAWRTAFGCGYFLIAPDGSIISLSSEGTKLKFTLPDLLCN